MGADAAVVAMLAEKRGVIGRAAWRFCRRHSGGMEMDEACQIAMIAAWELLREPRGDSDENLDALIMVVCACALDDELRSGRVTGVRRAGYRAGDRGPLSLNRPADDDDDLEIIDLLEDERAEDGYGAVLDESVVGRAMQALPERHRFVMYLHFFEGLTQEEIGGMLGVSGSRVSQIVRDAGRRMRPYIGARAA